MKKTYMDEYKHCLRHFIFHWYVSLKINCVQNIGSFSFYVIIISFVWTKENCIGGGDWVSVHFAMTAEELVLRNNNSKGSRSNVN